MGGSQPGASDPYLFEWNVGLFETLGLLDDSKKIQYIQFQYANLPGIDDIVIEYIDGSQHGIQVKYVNEGTEKQSITFGDIVRVKDSGISIIGSMAAGWKKLHNKGIEVECTLLTNKIISGIKTRRNYLGQEYNALPLGEYFEEVKKILQRPDGSEWPIINSRLRIQTEDLLSSCDLDEDDEVAFLESLYIAHIDGYHKDTERRCKEEILRLFSCDKYQSDQLYCRLFTAVGHWSATEYKDKKISKEDVLKALSHGEEKAKPNLLLPVPLFKARQSDTHKIIDAINRLERGYIFLSGGPGTGKTTTLAYLAQHLNGVRASYHAFRPKETSQTPLSGTVGELTRREMLTDLFNGLKRHFDGHFSEYGIPISAEYLDVELLKDEVIRMARLLYENTGEKTIILVDGLDHGARRGVTGSFLESLPEPNEVPEGVVFVLGGQPSESYPQYPLWLRRFRNDVIEINAESISCEDTARLIMQESSFSERDAKLVAGAISEMAGSGTLSTLYAVRAIKRFSDPGKALSELKKYGPSYDLDAYYDRIWSSLSKETGEIQPFFCIQLASFLVMMEGEVSLSCIASVIECDEGVLRSACRRLHPLIDLTTKNTVKIFNNDVLLFLTGVINEERNRECAFFAIESMADFLLSSQASYESRRYPIDLYMFVGKDDKALQRYDASFVLEALSSGVSRETLFRQTSMLYEKLIENPSFASCAHFLTGLKTLRQYFDSVGYSGYSRLNLGSFDLKLERLYPLELNIENIPIFSSVLTRVLEADSTEAELLLNGWMRDYNPGSFYADLRKRSDFFDVNDSLCELYEQWGCASVALRIVYGDIPEFSREHYGYFESFLNGMSRWCRERGDADSLRWVIKNYGLIPSIIKEFLYDIMRFDPSCKEDFSQDILKLCCRQDVVSVEVLIGKVLACVFSKDLPSEKSPLICLEDENHNRAEWWLIAFLDGFIGSKRDYSPFFRYRNMSDEKWAKDEEWTRFAYHIGFCVRLGVIPEDMIGEITAKIEQLFSRKNSLRFDYGDSFTVLCWVILSSPSAPLFEPVIVLIDSSTIPRNNSIIDIAVMRAELEQGNVDAVNTRICDLFGKKGEKTLCHDNPKYFYSCYKEIIRIVSPSLAENIEGFLKWGIIGTLEHKDYFISYLSELFVSFSSVNDNAWDDVGRELFYANAIADLSGDNRGSFYVNEFLYNSAAKQGYSAIHRLRGWEEKLSHSRDELSSQVRALIKNAKNKSELEILCALSVGLGCYYAQNEMETVRDCVSLAKERASVLNCEAELEFSDGALALIKNIQDYSAAMPILTAPVEEEVSSDIGDELVGKDLNSLLAVLKSLCQKGGREQSILRVLQEISEFKEIDDDIRNGVNVAIRSWLNEVATIAYYSSIENIVNVSIDITEDESLCYATLVLRDRDWLYKYNMRFCEEALFLACKNSLLYSDKNDAVHAMLELCAIVDIWITGASRLESPIDRPIDGPEDNCSSLEEFALNALLELCEARSVSVRHSSMQGIRALIDIENGILALLEKKWSSLSDNQRIIICQVFECFDLSQCDEGCSLILKIEEDFKKTCLLDEAIYLHLLLELQKKRNPREEITCTAAPVIPNISSENHMLSEIPNGALNILEYLPNCVSDGIVKRICRCDVKDYSKIPQEYNSGSSSRILSSCALKRPTMQILYQLEFNGVLTDINLSEKSARLLGSDASKVFVDAPKYWSIDETYIEKLRSDSVQQGMINVIANMLVDEKEVVLGFNLNIPEKQGTKTFSMTTVYGNSINNQCYAIGNIDLNREPVFPIENIPSGSITSLSMGVITTIYSHPGILVSNEFMINNSLSKDPFNLRYLFDGKEVLKYERIVFPSVHGGHSDPYDAVGILSRWVADRGWFESINENHSPVVQISNVEYVPWKS